jgi:hypothetical protein
LRSKRAIGTIPAASEELASTSRLGSSLLTMRLGQSQRGFIRVSWALIMLMWHHINKERDDKSFIGVEKVLWG